jgi:hypothetical protein
MREEMCVELQDILLEERQLLKEEKMVTSDET